MPSRNTQLGHDIEQASRILHAGGLVAIPTETVYGLAADALNPEAVAGIFAAKQRPEFDPLIVHIYERAQLSQLCREISPLAAELMNAFWPGPLTFILEKSASVPDLVTSGLSTVGVRMPEHETARELLRVSRLPLAAPSANLFGRTSPTTAAHVMKQLDGRIDYVLDGGECRVGVESTIVRCHEGVIQLLRPGGTPVEALEKFAPVIETRLEDNESPAAPGQLLEHYAPRTKLQIIDPQQPLDVPAGSALLTLQKAGFPDDFPFDQFEVVETLSESGDLTVAAARFFAALHALDDRGLNRIFATPFPNRELGLALNDRLRRAAASG